MSDLPSGENSSSSKFVVPLLAVIALCAVALTVFYVVLPVSKAVKDAAEQRARDEAAKGEAKTREAAELKRWEEEAPRRKREAWHHRILTEEESKEWHEAWEFTKTAVKLKMGDDCDVSPESCGDEEETKGRFSVTGCCSVGDAFSLTMFHFKVTVQRKNGEWVCDEFHSEPFSN